VGRAQAAIEEQFAVVADTALREANTVVVVVVAVVVLVVEVVVVTTTGR